MAMKANSAFATACSASPLTCADGNLSGDAEHQLGAAVRPNLPGRVVDLIQHGLVVLVDGGVDGDESEFGFRPRFRVVSREPETLRAKTAAQHRVDFRLMHRRIA